MYLGSVHTVGNGLIANFFKDLKFSRDVVIFASGVSNSSENSFEEFGREINLLKKTLLSLNQFHFVYFSTCSINSAENTPYIRHKNLVENIVKDNAISYNILRLPQVVGITKNNTLVSYFIKEILNNKPINVQVTAKRYLVDIEDVGRIARLIINNNHYENQTIDIAPAYDATSLDIVSTIAKILNSEVNINLINSGYSVDINNKVIVQILSNNDPIFKKDYWIDVLNKYVKKIAMTI